MSENIKTRIDAIKALDETLDLMRTSSKWYLASDIKMFVERLGIPLMEDEMLIILEKLKDDKHIEYYEKMDRYKITLDGLVFRGYQQTGLIADQNAKRIIRNERWLLRGTWFAGIAAFLLLLWQIFLYFYPIHAGFRYFWFQ